MGSHAVIYAVAALAVALLCLLAGFQWGRTNVKAQIEDAIEKEHVALDAREFAMRQQLEDAIAEIARLRPLAEELSRVQKRLEREQAKYQHMKADFDASYHPGASHPSDEGAPVQPPPSAPSADEAIQRLLQSLDVFNAPDADKISTAELPETVNLDPPASVRPTPAQPTPTQPSSVQSTPVPPNPAQPNPAQSSPAQQSVTAAPPRPTPPPPQAAQPTRPPHPITPAPPPIQREPVKTPQPPPPPPVPPPPPIPAQAEPRKPAPPQTAKPGQTLDEWQEFARQLEALTGKKK
jgi:hypothetical protein